MQTDASASGPSRAGTDGNIDMWAARATQMQIDHERGPKHSKAIQATHRALT
jgi:hypothetical protein